MSHRTLPWGNSVAFKQRRLLMLVYPSSPSRSRQHVDVFMCRQKGGLEQVVGEPDSDDEPETQPAVATTTTSGIRSFLPSFSNSKYARAHRRNSVRLPPGVREPGRLIKDSGDVHVEPKVWLANESKRLLRVFLSAFILACCMLRGTCINCLDIMLDTVAAVWRAMHMKFRLPYGNATSNVTLFPSCCSVSVQGLSDIGLLEIC